MNTCYKLIICIVMALVCMSATVMAWSGEAWGPMTRNEIEYRADKMIDSSWSPKNTIYNFGYGSTYHYFYSSSTYHGVAYSQDNPQENWSEFKHLVDNTNGGTTGYGNDCSGFVSMCWKMTTRHTTSTIESSSYVTLLGSDGQCDNVSLSMGDACNNNGSHIILFDYYSGTGGMYSMEQTPWTATRRYWSWSSLGAYRPIRRKSLERMRMDVWIQANSDSNIKMKDWDNIDSWDSSWGDYGEPSCGAASSPTATSREPGHLFICVLGNDGNLYYKSYVNGSWGSWNASLGKPSGVVLTDAPDACSWDKDRMDVVVRATNGKIYRKVWDSNNSWGSWIDMGGTATGSPSICSWGEGRLDIFAPDDDGSGILHRRYNGSEWLDWVERVGNPTYGLDACSSSYGKLYVFYTVADGRIYQRSYDSNGTWSSATILGGDFDSAPGAISYRKGQLMVFARNDSNGKLWKRNYINGSWDSWSDALDGDGFLGDGPDASSWSNTPGTRVWND